MLGRSTAAPLPEAPHALVTGAASGIGAALAPALLRRWPGARLTLVDRDEGGLARVAAAAGPLARGLACDLADGAALPGLVERALALAPVDLLVNCAGVMEVRSFLNTPWPVGETLLAVDLLAPLRLAHLLAPSMAARGQAAIVNVSSLAGRFPLKGCTYYGAAKAGLALASEILREELAPAGVHVLTVYPGPVATPLERGARAGFPDELLGRSLPTGRADELAARIVAALEARAPRLIYPAAYGIAYRALPLTERITLRLGPRPRA